jgi:hypothetical protein
MWQGRRVVTIFGSSRPAPGSSAYARAEKLGWVSHDTGGSCVMGGMGGRWPPQPWVRGVAAGRPLASPVPYTTEPPIRT